MWGSRLEGNIRLAPEGSENQLDVLSRIRCRFFHVDQEKPVFFLNVWMLHFILLSPNWWKMRGKNGIFETFYTPFFISLSHRVWLVFERGRKSKLVSDEVTCAWNQFKGKSRSWVRWPTPLFPMNDRWRLEQQNPGLSYLYKKFVDTQDHVLYLKTKMVEESVHKSKSN